MFCDHRIMPQNAKNQKQMKKSGKGKRSLATLPRVTQMPTTKRVLMSYAVGGAGAEAAAGTGLSTFYRLNSVYDPDATGVGASAGGYNTWSSLFLNYKVHRVTVRIQGTCVSASGSMCQVIIAPVASQSVVPANPHYWRLIPYAKVYTVVPNANGGKSTFEHVQSYDNAAVARVTKQQYDIDLSFSGAVGSNPARQNYLMVGMQSVSSGTPGTIVNAIQLTYEVEWYNPVPMQA